MNELTAEQIQEKIAQVQKDIEVLRQKDSKGAEHLADYMEYLKDELAGLRKREGQ